MATRPGSTCCAPRVPPARVLVLAIDAVEQSIKVAKTAREHFPQLTVVARARNVQHHLTLRELGMALVERETLGSALLSGRSVLEVLGWERHQARNLALRFERHTEEQLEAMALHRNDEDKLIAVAKQGRQRLESLFAQERVAAQRLHNRKGWDRQGDASAAKDGQGQA